MGGLIVNPVVLNLTKICFGYPGGPMILDHLDFHIHAGDRVGLVAPNGSGKPLCFTLPWDFLNRLPERSRLSVHPEMANLPDIFVAQN
jgi:ABC-type multidrug transport system fused ATPase/permease subunit